MDTRDSNEAQYVLLEGRPPIGDFVRFIKRTSIGGQDLEEAAIAKEWRAAHARIQQIELTEAGAADTDELPELPPGLFEFANAELQRSTEKNALAFLPYKWAIVELDRLVIYQKFINLNFVEQLKRSWPARPSQEDLVRIALGSERDLPPVEVVQIDGNTFSFVSASNDLRVLRIQPFKPEQIDDPALKQNAAAVLGLFVGYGSNLLQAVRIRNRTILSNGSHRAYALRSMGITHVPCAIQYVKEDELELLAMAEVKQNYDRYVRAPRPPLFKDYFDRRMHRIVPVHRRGLLLQAELTIRQSSVPAF